MNNLEEIILVKSLKKGDRAAFKFFFETYYDRLVAYINTFTNDKMTSEDIVQQAFISFWEDRNKIDVSKSPRSYLFTIAYHRYIDSIRIEKRKERFLDELWQRALSSRIKEDEEVLKKRIDKLKSILDTLPPKCKEIIHLNKVEGIKYKEIADKMCISIKTVESQMRIAFKKIRKAFKDDKTFLMLWISYFNQIKG